MHELTTDQYLASPLSKSDIEQFRSSQMRWVRDERYWSIGFLSLVNMPLFYLALTSGWIELLIAGGIVAALYVLFKSALFRLLDTKHPCRIVIDGYPFVTPQDLLSLQPTILDENCAQQSDFITKLAHLNRPMLRFEKSLLDGLSTTNQ